MDFLYSLDVSLLLRVNQGWACDFCDGFFIFITDLKNFIPVLVILVVYWLWKGGMRGRWLVVALLLGVLLTDQIVNRVVKPLVGRPRPCGVVEGLRNPDGCGPARSFPSSHAANIAGAMLLIGLAYRRWAWACLAMALLVGLSRVYLGVHYPSDVLAGWALGAALGTAVWMGLESRIMSVQVRKGRIQAPVRKKR